MKNLTKTVAVLLLLAMAVLIALSGTYAKYTTEVSGSSTATVAKFAVGGLTSDSFKLFETIKDSDGAAETDVVAGKVAPGTSGEFKITLTNDSDVTVNYKLTLAQSVSELPIVYSTDGSDYKALTDFNKEGTLAIGSTTQQTADVTIYWKWAFDGNDTTDTELGLAGTENVTVTATATFTQVD